MTDTTTLFVDIKNSAVMLVTTPGHIYFYDTQDVQRVLPSLSPNFVLQMLPDDLDIPEDFEDRLRYSDRRPYAHSMMSAAKLLIRCARR